MSPRPRQQRVVRRETSSINEQEQQPRSSILITVNQASSSTESFTSQATPAATATNRRKSETNSSRTTINHLNRNKRLELRKNLKRATVKFNRACKQIIKLDQKINELQNSYTNAIETDRKTFKIVYRMQLATLEGLHEAYISYIELKVAEIRNLKDELFGKDENANLINQ